MPAASPRQLLFICSQNRWRSLTAERLFDGHPILLVRSAGTEPGARVRVSAGHVGWADVVFVMEKNMPPACAPSSETSWRASRSRTCTFPTTTSFRMRRLCSSCARLQDYLGPAIFHEA